MLHSFGESDFLLQCYIAPLLKHAASKHTLYLCWGCLGALPPTDQLTGPPVYQHQPLTLTVYSALSGNSSYGLGLSESIGLQRVCHPRSVWLCLPRHSLRFQRARNTILVQENEAVVGNAIANARAPRPFLFCRLRLCDSVPRSLAASAACEGESVQDQRLLA